MGNLILSAFSDEYADSFKEQLGAMQSFGIDNIELRHVDGKNISLLTKKETSEAKKTLDYFGIGVSAIGSPIGKISLDGDLKSHFEMCERVFETANIFGTKFIRFFSFYAPNGKNIVDMKNEVFEAIDRLLTLAKKHGVILCHENEAKIYGDVPNRCREIIDQFNGEIKCVFDMGNFVLEGVDPYPDAYRLLQDSIAYFHIKDALAAGAIVPPGKGEAHIKVILAEHKLYSKENFFVSLEPHLQLFSGLNSLVGRSFENPYRYQDQASAFSDAVNNFKELI